MVRTPDESSSAGQGAAAIGNPMQKRKNPRILLLDPLESSGSFDGVTVQSVVQCLKEKTNIRGFNISLLERGGLRLKFKSQVARDEAEILLRASFSCFKARKLTWIENKKHFEIKIAGIPRSTNINAFKQLPNVLGVKQLKYGDLVLLIDTLHHASKYLNDGILLGTDYYSAVPYSFRPKVCCRQCGSMSHSACEIIKCFHCGEAGHQSHDCQVSDEDLPMYCIHCESESHRANDCPTFKEVADKAYKKKRQTYADALKKSQSKSVRKILSRPSSPQLDISKLVTLITTVVLRALGSDRDPASLLPMLQEPLQAMGFASSGNDSVEVSDIVTQCASVPMEVSMVPIEIGSDEEHHDSIHSEVKNDQMDCDSQPFNSQDDEPIVEPVRKKHRSTTATNDIQCTCRVSYQTCKKSFSKSHQIVCLCKSKFSNVKALLNHVKTCEAINQS